MKKVSFTGVFNPAVANINVPCFNDREWLESVARGGGTLLGMREGNAKNASTV